MKWLALTFLVVNGFVWFAGDIWVPGSTSAVVTARALPRVSTLKVDDVEANVGTASAFNIGNERLKAKGEPGSNSEAKVAGDLEIESESASVAGRACVRLGWFETAEEAVGAYRSLGSPGEGYEVSEEDRSLEPLHWVIVPPQPREKALRLFNDLQRRGIDSYLVARGENSNAISLGLFQSKDAAERVLQAKKRQNLNAVLANFPRNQLSYALVFEASLTGNGDAGDGWVGDFQDDFEMVEISRCEGVATTPENP